MTWNEIGAGKYAVLTTFRKDGRPVGTPVWLAPDGERIVVWTNTKSYKLKRIQRNPEVTLQLCDMRGATTRGDVVTGRAAIQDEAGTERTRALIGKKYGIMGTLMVRSSKLFKGADSTVGIIVEPSDS